MSNTITDQESTVRVDFSRGLHEPIKDIFKLGRVSGLNSVFKTIIRIIRYPGKTLCLNCLIRKTRNENNEEFEHARMTQLLLMFGTGMFGTVTADNK